MDWIALRENRVWPTWVRFASYKYRLQCNNEMAHDDGGNVRKVGDGGQNPP